MVFLDLLFNIESVGYSHFGIWRLSDILLLLLLSKTSPYFAQRQCYVKHAKIVWATILSFTMRQRIMIYDTMHSSTLSFFFISLFLLSCFVCILSLFLLFLFLLLKPPNEVNQGRRQTWKNKTAQCNLPVILCFFFLLLHSCCSDTAATRQPCSIPQR